MTDIILQRKNLEEKRERGKKRRTCHSLLRFFLLLFEPAVTSLEGLFGLFCLSHSPSCHDLKHPEQKSNLHFGFVHSALRRLSCFEEDLHCGQCLCLYMTLFGTTDLGGRAGVYPCPFFANRRFLASPRGFLSETSASAGNCFPAFSVFLCRFLV